MDEKYLRVPDDEELYVLISKWIYCKYYRSCSLIRNLDNSIEFPDLVNDCYISLVDKKLKVCKIKSYVGSFLSNRIRHLKKRKKIKETTNFSNLNHVVSLAFGEYYNEFM